MDKDTPDAHTEAANPDAGEEADAKAWIHFVSICVYIFLLRHMQFKVNLYNRVILTFKPY